MSVFGRKIKLSQLLSQLWQTTLLLPRIWVFTNPYKVFKAYLSKKNLPKQLQFKNGFQLHLSSHPEDIVTAIVVCCKHDYGSDFEGKTIIDIGANIGAFSLFAAHKGAKQIVAIEPVPEAVNTLRRSVEANKLQNAVTVLQAAVTSQNGSTLYFPTQSSPNNAPADTTTNTIAVSTMSLKTIVSDHFNVPIDLLKIDCEGGEYDILYNADDTTLAQIHEIRMELHGDTGQKEALLQHLKAKGFRLHKYNHDNAWLTNTQA